MELSNRFYNVLNSFRMDKIEFPLFYNSNIGIRFDIGDSAEMEVCSVKNTINPKYIDFCYNRTNEILNSLACAPDILVIQLYFADEKMLQEDISSVLMLAELPFPQTIEKKEIFEDDELINVALLFWDLSKSSISKEKLLKEVIKSNLGGEHLFTASVFWVYSKNNMIFHLYDDRGADLIAGEKSQLIDVYKKLNDFILEHDKDRIYEIFGK